MEEVIDKLIEEVRTLNDDSLQDFLPLTDVKWDDPGLVLVDEYPYAFVAPVVDEPKLETVGRAGYDVRNLVINIVFVINQSDYFDPLVSEVSGSRELVRASSLLRAHLRRLGKRQLDGLSGVRNLTVQSTNFVPDVRGDAFVRSAVTTLIVERQYQHQD